MARVQWIVVAGLWLVVLAVAVRARAKGTPDRRWLAAIETLRAFDAAPVRQATSMPQIPSQRRPADQPVAPV